MNLLIFFFFLLFFTSFSLPRGGCFVFTFVSIFIFVLFCFSFSILFYISRRLLARQGPCDDAASSSVKLSNSNAEASHYCSVRYSIKFFFFFFFFFFLPFTFILIRYFAYLHFCIYISFLYTSIPTSYVHARFYNYIGSCSTTEITSPTLTYSESFILSRVFLDGYKFLKLHSVAFGTLT